MTRHSQRRLNIWYLINCGGPGFESKLCPYGYISLYWFYTSSQSCIHFTFCHLMTNTQIQLNLTLSSASNFSQLICVYLVEIKDRTTHRLQLLKLDIQPCSHLVVEVCIPQGISTAPTPSKMTPHPLQVLCLVHCKNRWVDGAIDLLV